MLKLILTLLGASVAVALSESESCRLPSSGSSPWLVAIIYNNKFRCSGSLIKPHVVLTSASCVDGKDVEYLIVTAGVQNFTLAERNYIQHLSVSYYVTHEKYNRTLRANNYALVYLSKPVTLTERVALVCLPEVDDDFTGSKCFEYGWLRNAFGGRRKVYPKKKRVVLKHEVCQNNLRQLSHQQDFFLEQTSICTIDKTGSNAYLRIAGSSLLCPLRNSDLTRYVLAGIVSWSHRGKNAPTIYANVIAARNWINEKLKLHRVWS